MGEDLKLLCEANRHESNSTTFCCIQDEITLVQLNNIWDDTISFRTPNNIAECRQLVVQHTENPMKKQLISCSKCGKFEHIKNNCKIVKEVAVCGVCKSKGHTWNSNKIEKNKSHITAAIANCSMWTSELHTNMLNIAKLEARYVELDLAKTKGIYFNLIFSK